MKSNDIDQLLNGLLGDPSPAKKQPKKQEAPVAEEPKRPVASENARRRVEEIMRSVEMESSRKKETVPPAPKPQPIPKREPVVVPPPISHFSEEPSQNPAVRMRDRLDETALPMIDSERKPTQIIPPKPKPEPEPVPKKKRKKSSSKAKTAQPEVQRTAPKQEKPEKQAPVPKSVDIPAPQKDAPKRKIPHIIVPDELPPDIPRDTSIADEIRRKKIEAFKRAMEQQAAEEAAAAEVPQISEEEYIPEEVTASPELAVSMPEEPEQTEPEPEYDEREQEILRKAESIKSQIRRAMEEIKAVPEQEEDAEETSIEEPESEPETAAEEPEPEEAKTGKRRGFFKWKRKQQTAEPSEPEKQPEPSEMEAVSEETAEEMPEEETPAEEPVLIEDIVPDDGEELRVSEEPEAEAESEPETPAVPRLRHLSMPEEPEEKAGFFRFFSRKKKRTVNEINEAPEDTKEISEKTELIPEPVEYDEIPEEDDADLTIPDMVDFDTEVPDEKMELTSPDENEEPESSGQSETESAPEPEVVPSEEESIHVALPGEEERKQKRSAFAAAIRAALDENAQELEDMKAEPLPEESEIDVALGKSRYRRRSTYFTVGILCSALAVVGIVTCVMQGVKMVRNFTESSSLKSELEDVLYPVAVVDLPDFTNPEEASPELLMSAAMIDLLMYADLSQYPESFDVITIPAEDVRSRTERMFGMQLPGDYVTLQAAGETFYYDIASGCYNVPTSPVIFSYSPDIQEIRSSGENMYTLTVDYHSDTAQWQQRSENFSTFGEKTLEITLRKNGDDYQIVSILNISDDSDAM